DRLALEGGVLQDLDAGVESIQIHVEDRLGRPLAHGCPLPSDGGSPDHPAEPGLACHSRPTPVRFPAGAGARSSMGDAIASRSRPSARARCSAVRSQTSSAMIPTPFTPVRRSCPHTAIAYAWKTVRATLGWTDSKTVTSMGPVASSSDTKMMRWPLRTAGVCEAIFTPATMTHVS